MKKGIVYILIGLFLSACSGVIKDGGSCDYENIEVTCEVTKVFGDHDGYEIKLTPISDKDKLELEDSYTNDIQYVKCDMHLGLSVGKEFPSEMQIMTSGSCNPRPMSINYYKAVLEVVNKQELEK